MKYPLFNEKTPHTCSNANVDEYRDVHNARVIMVSNASYRKATFDGIFELMNKQFNVDPIIEQPSGKIKVEVLCSWYGGKAPNTYPKIDLSNAGGYEIIDNYSGQVVDNIGSF